MKTAQTACSCNCYARPHPFQFHRKSSMDRVIGASDLVGGLLGSSSRGRALDKVAKKDDRGNSNARGEKKAGVDGSSADLELKLRAKDRSMGFSVISAIRGDIKSSHSILLGRCCG